MAKPYEYLWRNKFLTIEANNIDDMIRELETAVNLLKAFKELEKEGKVEIDMQSACDDYIIIYTFDKTIAKKYKFVKS